MTRDPAGTGDEARMRVATALADRLIPGSPPVEMERVDELAALVARVAASPLGADPRLWSATDVGDVVETLLAEPDSGAGRGLASLLRRAGASYFARPGSWPALGYRELPEGAAWPPPSAAVRPVIGSESLHGDYDVIVVGAGAGGGVAADVLAAAGLRVLLVDRGRAYSPTELGVDHQRNHRVSTGLPHQLDLPERRNPRVVDGSVVDSGDPAWGGNASALGGGTLVYGGQAWRLAPEDFRMGSVYGPDFPDWPIDYDDLEPYYDAVEHAVGVCGPSRPRRFDGPRRRGYPMPPFSESAATPKLRAGAATLGIDTDAVPLLINSVPFRGRPAHGAALRRFPLPRERQERHRIPAVYGHGCLLRRAAGGNCRAGAALPHRCGDPRRTPQRHGHRQACRHRSRGRRDGAVASHQRNR